MAILNLLRASWLRYAVLGAVAGVAIAFGAGYLKGYGKAEAKAQRDIAEAVAKERARLLTIAQSDLEIAVAAATSEQRIREAINEIPIFTDCYESDWLRSFNAAIRAANTASPAETP